MSSLVFKSSLITLVDDVSARLVEWGVTASVEVGWLKRPRQDNQGPGGANRVVFVPSDDKGKGGKLRAPTQRGDRRFRLTQGDPDEFTSRSLLTWDRKILVSVWASDASSPDDERKQIDATELLFEWVVRAVHVASGAFACANWDDELDWVLPHERAYGRELQTLLTLESPIMDIPREIAYPGGVSVERENS